MEIIRQKELRNNVSEVLRRAQAGEQLTITVAGRPVARLGPAEANQWVSGAQLRAIWSTPKPRALVEDLGRFPGAFIDPWG